MSNSTVNSAATQRGALNRSGVVLLGVFGPQNSMRALIRMPGGQVREVKPGARLNGGKVAAIDAEGLILQKNGTANRLSLVK
ncbi:MAG: hypothetical protein AAF408_09525 [Pseudomonadota bacterium]